LGLLVESEKYNYKKLLDETTEELRSEKRKSEKLLLQLTTNAETGLPNSVVLHRELDSLLEADTVPKAVIFVALNENFGMLKRTFSTKIPEWILYQTSLRLQKIVGPSGRIYHTHEDEFLVLMDRSNLGQDLEVFARNLVEIIEKSHVMAGYTISLGVHLGIALYPEHGKKKATLLRHADIALSEAGKEKTSFRIFSPELKDKIVERVELQNGILLALESQANLDEKPQFELFFHPQVQIAKTPSGKWNGRIVGAETLIRWKHPTLGFIPPSKFIPVAEETGLIIPLGHWIFHTAIAYIQDLARQKIKDMPLSVNFSSLQFNNDDVSYMIHDIVQRRGIPPSLLKIEITESGLMRDYTTTIEKMKGLRQEGFKILVDDFGTGYSSLSYLKELPIDVVKVDKSFIDHVTHDASDQALTRAIVTLAKDLHLGVIVEGTETREQIEWLYEIGCDTFQGYYFSKPTPYNDFLIFLKNFPQILQEKMSVG
jgi:EAL domain-containing protein (putative c-di-GMP-specific phosphodiesterase class I)/GGDEF domain-containing protein